ncbi:ATP-dependent DNA helicase RecG [Granulicella rosea]|uniref:Probable DNA 3'-5' helicase RecG n=1 Tax=Granulicella rosea TaxID=474952 RepID=A0A239JP21_9BACT|nr:ATP-dependent DNA helicase RecG [Granulicella rosea]SNT07766.1 ATP-dependent DNA helicase RecG [Granulicella rosea]
MLELSTSIQYVKRVGERIGEKLAERGVETVEDLLYHLPFRYEDRLNPKPISALVAGEMASVIGEVRGSGLLTTRTGTIFEVTVGQGLQTVKCMWFNGRHLEGKFRLGQMVALYGRMEPSRSGGAGRFKMIQPQFELLPSLNGPAMDLAMLEVGRIVPVYSTLGGTTPWGAKLTSKWTRQVMWTVLEELAGASGEEQKTNTGVLRSAQDDGHFAEGEKQILRSAKDDNQKGRIEKGKVEETLPAAMLERLRLPGRLAALRSVHFPEAGTQLVDLMSAATPGQRRLIFEELFYLELGLELKRRKLRERVGTQFAVGDGVRTALKQVLPFHPTRAQKRVLGEIVADMRKPQPMRRLLQGDVGSGKTIVAMQASLVAIENGYQAALMAPTEILATQHYLSARKLLRDVVSPRTGKPYRVTLLTGSLDIAEKRQARGRILRGETELVIGTHALLEEKVDFANLGLVIVDEQHRFGVQQRFKLMKKPNAQGEMVDPDVLVMTATPIPRTLALTLYGDMDVSVIDELPPGRTPIVTRRTTEERAADVWEFVRKQVGLGRQAYIVYPVIEGAKDDQPELDFAADAPEDAPKPAKGKKQQALFEKAKLRSATQMHDELRAGPLEGLRLGLLHGRMSADDKEVAMRRFQRGETDVLIATTVIEVGVDVPNATLMVIEHAERFGLAQMHQLRGRVGRGAAKSFCILMTGAKVSESAEERLAAMTRTQDGFKLAELDLEQRGPGEFFGTKQAGLPEFRVANLVRDRDVLELAKVEAARFVDGGEQGMSAEEAAGVWDRLKLQWQRRYGLVEA